MSKKSALNYTYGVMRKEASQYRAPKDNKNLINHCLSLEKYYNIAWYY